MANNFNYVKVPGPLLYSDKQYLDDFNVEDNPSLNYFIQEKLFERYSTVPTYEDLAKDLFNCAYYICTMALADSHPERRFGAYLNIVQQQLRGFGDYVGTALAIILLQMWARRWDMPPHRLKRLYDLLDKELREKYDDIFKGFFFPITQDMQAVGLDKIEYQNEFKPREINIRVLKDVSIYWDWNSELGNDEGKVWEFIIAIGKTENEQKIIVEFLREEMYPVFQNRFERKYFFDDLDRQIHKLHHGKEEQAQQDAEFEAEMERQTLEEIENTYARERVPVLEKENAKLRDEIKQIKDFLQGTFTIDDINEAIKQGDFGIGPDEARRMVADAIARAENGVPSVQHPNNEALKNNPQRLADIEATIKRQEEQIKDYSARFDPLDIKKNKVCAMTGKQHVILFLAVLASHNRLPGSRKSMSSLMSFISSRNESTMIDYLGDAITKDECEILASIFESEKQPFIANIIRQLPEKLEKDKSEKNRVRALKKNKD